ncbi:hypothetical protein [Pseudorhodoferax sp.]|uniref:hypothetical protein n=1 Tax=Pseudorhodoferax sp. TaxID=1993553 RepID=UPI0039E23626
MKRLPVCDTGGRDGSRTSMWLLVLVLGLGGLGTAVGVGYVQWRKARRRERARLWRVHDEWQRSRRQGPLA